MNEKIEQAKDKIAQGYGYNDWKGLEYHYQIMLKSFIPKAIWNQVAERYQELMDEWISVDDRLPKHNEIVLGLFNTENSDWYKYPTNLTLLRFCKESEFIKYFIDKSTLLQVNSKNVTHFKIITPPKQ